LVRDDELAAGELAAAFPHISRPAVSQHLRVLDEAGLVTIRRDGNRRLYLANADGLTGVWKFIDGMWTDSLAKLKHAAERAERVRLENERPKRSTT
jgi:DNA-binding transcriptional ArsR family regulator